MAADRSGLWPQIQGASLVQMGLSLEPNVDLLRAVFPEHVQ